MTIRTCAAATLASVVCLSFGFVGEAQAAQYRYTAIASACTATCDNFAAFDVGSQISGTLVVNNGANGAWTSADIVEFRYQVYNPLEPIVGYTGLNPTTANPLPLASNTTPIRDLGGEPVGSVPTGGTAGIAGQLNNGFIFHEFEAPPFNGNDSWIVFDLGSGAGRMCLTYGANGCIPATQFMTFAGPFARLADVSVDGLQDQATGDSRVVFAATDFSTPPQGTVYNVNDPGTVISANAVAASADAVPEMVATFDYQPVTSRGAASPGIATLNVNYAAGGTMWAFLTDAGSGTVLGKAPFLSSSYRALDLGAGFTTSGPFQPRLGLLAEDRSTGKPVVQTVDFGDNTRTTTQFFSPGWDAVGMATFSGLDAGTQTSVGVVAIAQSNGRIRLDVKNVDVGGGTDSYPIKNLNWTAQDVAAFRHNLPLLQSHGAAVLVTNGSGRIDAALVNVSPTVAEGGGSLPASINFLSNEYDAVAIATVASYNGVFATDALAVLGVHRTTGEARVQVKAVSSGVLLSTADFLPSDYEKVELLVVPDVNGNNSPEIGVLGTDSALPTRIHFKDSTTGAFVSHVFAP